MAKQYKKDFGYSYCFGVYPTLELIKYHPTEILNIFIDVSGTENRGVEEIKVLAKEKNIPLETNSGMLRNLTNQNNLYAGASFKKYPSEIKSDQNHIVLVSPMDLGNLGTIVRTMVAFDVVNLVIIKPATDIFDPKVVRSSMGALFQINFQYFDTFAEYKQSFPAQHLYPFLTSGQEQLPDVKFDPPFSLIFGNESSGLSKEFANLGNTIRIEHSDKVDSLSLPISVGLGLFKAHAI